MNEENTQNTQEQPFDEMQALWVAWTEKAKYYRKEAEKLNIIAEQLESCVGDLKKKLNRHD